MRILGKGKTAQAIKEVYPEAKLFDDGDKDIYDIDSEDVTVVSPGIPPHNYLVQNTKNKISDYDLFLSPQNLNSSKSQNLFTIWISGTNGKTTTTQMIYHLLKDNGFECGGNIGTPLASLIKNSTFNIQNLILETSSFTLHYTNIVKPNIYILLPISDDHLSWHGTFEEYEQSKLKPLLMMGENDIAIVPAKYKDILTKAKLFTYEDSDELCKLFNIEKEKIKFNEPFLLDSLLALSVAKIVNLNIDYEKINSFRVDAHKVEEFKDHKERIWVDDSKATNVDATIWALKGYRDKKINLILGGDDKGADLTPLFEELVKYNVEVFNIGSNRKRLEKFCEKFSINFNTFENLENAVQKIGSKAQKKEVSILSPAAASLDQFSSYKQRGEKFKEFVKNLRKI